MVDGKTDSSEGSALKRRVRSQNEELRELEKNLKSRTEENRSLKEQLEYSQTVVVRFREQSQRQKSAGVQLLAAGRNAVKLLGQAMQALASKTRLEFSRFENLFSVLNDPEVNKLFGTNSMTGSGLAGIQENFDVVLKILEFSISRKFSFSPNEQTLSPQKQTTEEKLALKIEEFCAAIDEVPVAVLNNLEPNLVANLAQKTRWTVNIPPLPKKTLIEPNQDFNIKPALSAKPDPQAQKFITKKSHDSPEQIKSSTNETKDPECSGREDLLRNVFRRAKKFKEEREKLRQSQKEAFKSSHKEIYSDLPKTTHMNSNPILQKESLKDTHIDVQRKLQFENHRNPQRRLVKNERILEPDSFLASDDDQTPKVEKSLNIDHISHISRNSPSESVKKDSRRVFKWQQLLLSSQSDISKKSPLPGNRTQR